VLQKEIGETPLETIEKWRGAHPAYKEVPASYAGRLDPMASGKLLVLLGEECKRQAHYAKLDKEYLLEILLGAGSDTGDVLGLLSTPAHFEKPPANAILHALEKERGAHRREYPAYCSKTVHGKPLFLYALTNTLHTITIPTHTERLYRVELLKQEDLSHEELEKRVGTMLDTIRKTNTPSKALGEDFRIDNVRASWKEFFEHAPESHTVLTVRVCCSSGTYMRSLAGRVGESLHTKGLALSIHRTRIGTFIPLFGEIGFWLRQY
jgi:tRNA pseudouridine55 synthase